MSSTSSSSEVKLVGLIYSAAANGGEWPRVLAEISSIAGRCWVALHAHDAERRANIGFLTHNYDRSFHDTYTAHFAALNPWNDRIVGAPVGRVIASPALMPPEQLRRTEFYNDWIHPQEDIGTGAGVTIHRSGSRFVRLSCNIRFRDMDASLQPLMRLLALAAPHLRAAFDLSRLLAGAGREADWRVAVANLPYPGIVLDRRGRCRFVNPAAERIMGRGSGMRIMAGDVEFADPVARATLASAVAAAVSLQQPVGSFPVHIDGRRVPAELWPYPALRDECPFDAFMDDVPAALLIVRHESTLSAGVDQLAARAGFTAAERAACLHLAEGGSVATFAAARGVSIHTARNQVRAVIEKAGVTRQSALLALVAQQVSQPRL